MVRLVGPLARHLATLLCTLGGFYLLTCVPAPTLVPGVGSPTPTQRAASRPSGTVDPSEADAGTDALRGAAAADRSAGGSCRGDRFAVVAESPTAAEAAMDVLDAGGSAADAAVVGLLVAGVTQPVSSGIGGGGFVLYWDAQARRVTVLDFREVAPAAARAEDYDVRPPPESRRGVLVGVPGEVAGLSEVHGRWGRLAFAELVARAARIARQGFAVSHHQARTLRWSEPWALGTAPVAAVFAPLGKLLAAGEMARSPVLGATLERIAAEGRAAFYEGAIARDVVDSARSAGSRMTLADLRGYGVVERQPLRVAWQGYDVNTMPPPSAGGMLLAQTLTMHSRDELAALGYASGAYRHLLAETFRGAVADRVRAIGDPAFVAIDVDGLVAPARMRARRARIALDRTMEAPAFPLREAGTSHFAAVDADGNVIAITSTVNNMFGARIVTAGGFPLNDELDDFTEPRVARRFGTSGGPNQPRGGARPVSSMTPTIVVRDGRAVLALGGSGGTRIATAVTQVLLAKTVFGRSTEQAVADLRVHTPPEGSLLVEPGAPPELLADLRARGEVVSERPDYGAVGLLALDPTACPVRLEASGDPRKGGVGIVR